MMRSRALMFLLCISAMVSSQWCYASDGSSASVDFEVSAVGKYVWRGLVCNEDPVIQPSLTVSWQSGLSVNLWGSMDTTDSACLKGKCSELDLTLAYVWESGAREWEVAYADYSYPHTSFPGTSEISVSCALGGPFDIGVCVNRDVDQARGLYTALSWCRTAQLGREPLYVSGEFGFADKRHSDYYFGIRTSGLTDAYLCVELPIEAAGGWTISPSIVYSSLLNGSLRRSVEDPDNVVIGVRLAKSI